MTQKNIKFLAIGRLVKHGDNYKRKLILHYHADSEDKKRKKIYGVKDFIDTTENILQKRQDFLVSMAPISLTSDDAGYPYFLHVLPHLLEASEIKAKQIILVFFAVTLPAFKHDINTFMEYFRDEFIKNNKYSDIRKATTGSLMKPNKRVFKDIIKVYDSPNKLEQAQRKVDGLAADVKENIKLVLKNNDALEDLEESAESLMKNSNTFRRRSGKVKNLMKWRYYKLRALIAVLVIAILTYVGVQFIPTD